MIGGRFLLSLDLRQCDGGFVFSTVLDPCLPCLHQADLQPPGVGGWGWGSRWLPTVPWELIHSLDNQSPLLHPLCFKYFE